MGSQLGSDLVASELTSELESGGRGAVATAWRRCLAALELELGAQVFNTWVRPVQFVERGDRIGLLAPNRYVLDHFRDHILPRVQRILGVADSAVTIEIGTLPPGLSGHSGQAAAQSNENSGAGVRDRARDNHSAGCDSSLNQDLTFERFVEGKSNQLARAAAIMASEKPGRVYNPLFIYGGVGLGKTHLMHAAGHAIRVRNPGARVLCVRSERFVHEMVRAIQNNRMNDFKAAYRKVDALLIDDIQFFIDKDKTQEEFFHTFNELIERGGQVIITADRFPKDLTGVEERLISRFESGLTVAIEAPELETRVAILMSKAEEEGLHLPEEVAFFVAKRVRANVRELEGALRRLSATAAFTSRPIDIDLAQQTLKDLLAYQDRQITISNIQKTVGEYYKIRIADMQSKERTRSVARPRQMAMALTKELTAHSLPEIGEAFGGRDHTTVIHACRKIAELLQSDNQAREDYANLQKLLAR